MDKRTRIKTYFKEFIKKTFKRESIQNFFLNHPYRKKFFNNMCEELLKVEYARLRTFDSILFKKTVEDMTRLFCETALKQKEQQLLTDIQKSVLSKKFAEQELDQKELDEEIEGIIDAKRSTEQLNSKPK